MKEVDVMRKGRGKGYLGITLLLLGVMFACVDAGHTAGKFPTKLVTLLVPYNTGGSMDNAARGIQPYLQRHLGVPVVVMNLPGANGILGMNKVYDGPADGHTVLVAANSYFMHARLYAGQTRFEGDIFKAFAPVASWHNGDAQVICVKKESPIKNFDDLVAKAKGPGVTFGLGGGMGGTDHFVALAIQKVYGGLWTIVPYQSGGELAASILGGQIDTGPVGIATAAGSQNLFRALVHTGAKRIVHLPDCPTFVELGQKSLDIGYHVGGMVKRGTDPEIISILEQGILKAANDPDFRKWAENTKTPAGEPYNTQTWREYLENVNQSTAGVVPLMQESLRQLQKGK